MTFNCTNIVLTYNVSLLLPLFQEKLKCQGDQLHQLQGDQLQEAVRERARPEVEAALDREIQEERRKVLTLERAWEAERVRWQEEREKQQTAARETEQERGREREQVLLSCRE